MSGGHRHPAHPYTAGCRYFFGLDPLYCKRVLSRNGTTDISENRHSGFLQISGNGHNGKSAKSENPNSGPRKISGNGHNGKSAKSENPNSGPRKISDNGTTGITENRKNRLTGRANIVNLTFASITTHQRRYSFADSTTQRATDVMGATEPNNGAYVFFGIARE